MNHSRWPTASISRVQSQDEGIKEIHIAALLQDCQSELREVPQIPIPANEPILPDPKGRNLTILDIYLKLNAAEQRARDNESSIRKVTESLEKIRKAASIKEQPALSEANNLAPLHRITRRREFEIHKDFMCLIPNCQKRYATGSALKLHSFQKHNIPRGMIKCSKTSNIPRVQYLLSEDEIMSLQRNPNQERQDDKNGEIMEEAPKKIEGSSNPPKPTFPEFVPEFILGFSMDEE